MQKSKKEVFLSDYKSLETKLIKLRAENKVLRSNIRYLRKSVKRISDSRAQWKRKAKSRLLAFNNLEDKLLRIESCPNFERHSYPLWVMEFVIQLRVLGKCSYGNICRVLQIVYLTFFLKRSSNWAIPCEQTVQNWVRKVGYYALELSDNQHEEQEVCVVIDESIRVGTDKLLLALVCPAQKWESGALTTQDVSVLHLEGSDQWKGTQIAQVLRQVFERHRLKVKYIVSDEGNNLKCAIRLLGVPHVPDISHALGTCLRRVFDKDTDYKVFTKEIGKAQSRLSMGEDAYLRPPQQRCKARFLNQFALLDWVNCLKSKWDELSPKAQKKLAPVLEQDAVISELDQCLQWAKKISILLKNKGLNQENLTQIRSLWGHKQHPERVQKFIQEVENYVQTYHNILNQLPENQTIHGCSDVIESIFGMYKNKVSDNYFVGTSTLSLELPLVCLNRKQLLAIIQKALKDVKMTHLKHWKNNKNTQNQAIKRVQFLKN